MRKGMFLFLALFVVAVFLLSESLSYAQRPNPPGPKGGPGASPRKDRDNNPPGPQGGRGTNWENPRGPAGGPGAGPDRRPMGNPPGPVGGPGAGPQGDRDNNPPGPVGGLGTNWENQPGPAGGPGASPNERPPMPPPPLPPTVEGVSNAPSGQQVVAESAPAELQQKAIVDQPWEKAADINKDGIVDRTEMRQWKQNHPRRGNN